MSRGIQLTKAHRGLIAREMDRSGLTQAALAKACKTSQPSVQRVLRGEQAPSFTTLCAICDALRLGFSYDGKLTLYVEE